MRKIKPYVDVMVRLNFETGEVICPNEEAGSLLEKFIQDRMHRTPVDGEGKVHGYSWEGKFPHDCEYVNNPEAGKCDICEQLSEAYDLGRKEQ